MSTHILHWLLGNSYWIATQGVVQNSTIIFWTWAALMMWHHSCDAHLWCWRPGRHHVEGTSWKVCSNHHTAKQHKHLHRSHALKHPHRGL